MINAGTVNIIELTQGKMVLVQGIIGEMAARQNWYYASPYGRRGKQVLRVIPARKSPTGKRIKESLKRFLCGLKPGEKAQVRILDKSDVNIDGKMYINYLTNNLHIIR